MKFGPIQTVHLVSVIWFCLTPHQESFLKENKLFLSFFIPQIQTLGAARQIECTLYGLTEIVSSYIVSSPSSRVDGRLNSSSVGKLDQAGRPASACTGKRAKKILGTQLWDTGSQPKQLHIRGDT
jgi:hypothetical protein